MISTNEVSIRLGIRRMIQYTDTFEYFLIILVIPFMAGTYFYLTTKVSPLPSRTPVLGNAVKGPPITSVHKGNRGISSRRSMDFRSFQKYLVQHRVKTLDIYEHTSLYKNLVDVEYPHLERTAIVGYAGLSDETVATLTPILNSWLGLKTLGPEATPYAWYGYKLIHPGLSEWCNQRLRLEYQYDLENPKIPYNPFWHDSQRQDYYRKFYTSHFRAQGAGFRARKMELRSWAEKGNFKYLVENNSQWKSDLNEVKHKKLDPTKLNTFQGIFLTPAPEYRLYSKKAKKMLSVVQKMSENNLVIKNYKTSGDGIRDIWPRQASNLHVITSQAKFNQARQAVKDYFGMPREIAKDLGIPISFNGSSWVKYLQSKKLLRFSDYESKLVVKFKALDFTSYETFTTTLGRWFTLYPSRTEFIAFTRENYGRYSQYYTSYAQQLGSGLVHRLLREIFAYLPSYNLQFYVANQYNKYKASYYIDHSSWPSYKPLWSKSLQLSDLMLKSGLEMDKVFPSSYSFFHPYFYAQLLQFPSHWRQRNEMSDLKPFILKHKEEGTFVKNVTNHTVTSNLRYESIKTAHSQSKEQEYWFSRAAIEFQEEVNRKQREIYDVYKLRNEKRISGIKKRTKLKHQKKVTKDRKNRTLDLLATRNYRKSQILNFQALLRVYPVLRNYFHEHLIRFNDIYAWWYKYDKFESKFKHEFLKNKDFHEFIYGNNPYEYIATYVGESRLKTLWTLGKTDKLITNKLLYKPYKNTLKNKKGISIVGYNGNVKWNKLGKKLTKKLLNKKRGSSYFNGKATKLYSEFTKQPDVYFFVDNLHAGPNDLRSRLRLSLEVPKSVPYPLSSKRRPDSVGVPRSPYSALKRRLVPNNINPRKTPEWWEGFENTLTTRPSPYFDEIGRQHRYLDKPVPEDIYLPWDLLAWDLHKKEVDSHMSVDVIESFFGKWLEDDCLIHEAVEADILTSMENYLHFTFLGQFPKDMVNPVYRKYVGFKRRKGAKPKKYRMTKVHNYLSNNYRANFPEEVEQYLTEYKTKEKVMEVQNDESGESNGANGAGESNGDLSSTDQNNGIGFSSLYDDGFIDYNALLLSESDLSNGVLSNNEITNGESNGENGEEELAAKLVIQGQVEEIPSDFTENVKRTEKLPNEQLLLSVPDLTGVSEKLPPLEAIKKPSIQELYVAELSKTKLAKGRYFTSTSESKMFANYPIHGSYLDSSTFDFDGYQLKLGYRNQEDVKKDSILNVWKEDFLELANPSQDKEKNLFEDLMAIYNDLPFSFNGLNKSSVNENNNQNKQEDNLNNFDKNEEYSGYKLDDLYRESDIEDFDDYKDHKTSIVDKREHVTNVPFLTKTSYLIRTARKPQISRFRKYNKQVTKRNRVRSANERFMDSVYLSQIPTYETDNSSSLCLNIDLFGNHKDIGALDGTGNIISGEPELDDLATTGHWQLRHKGYSKRVKRKRLKNNKFAGGRAGYDPIINADVKSGTKRNLNVEAQRPKFEPEDEMAIKLNKRRIHGRHEYIVRLPQENVKFRQYRLGTENIDIPDFDPNQNREPFVPGNTQYPLTDYALISNGIGPISIQRGHGRTLMAKALPKVSTLYQYREGVMPIPYISPSELGSIVHLITAQEDDTRKAVMMTNITIHEPVITRILQTLWMFTAMIFTIPYVLSVGMYISYYGKLFFLPILLSDKMPENLPDLIINTSQPTIRFSDVAGLSLEKQKAREVVSFLTYAPEYVEMGARIPKGILFLGDPGTGKTLLALAIAGEAAVSFIWESGAHLLHKKKGIAAQRIKAIYKTARDKGSCVIFIDEIDAFAMQRTYLTGKTGKTSTSWIDSLDLNTHQGMKRFNQERDRISSTLPTDKNTTVDTEENVNELEVTAHQVIGTKTVDKEEEKSFDQDNKEEAIGCLNQLLTEIDGIDANKYTILTLAATNRGHLIDEALLRPGRIERSIVLGLPSLSDRTEIVNLYGNGLLGPDVDPYVIALETPGMSGGGIATIFGEAILNMMTEQEDKLSLERIHEAMNHYYTPELKTIILGGPSEKKVVKDGLVFTQIDLNSLDVINPHTISLYVKDALGSSRLRMDAYYWAGRALLSILLPNHEPLTRIDLKTKMRGAWIQFYSTQRYLLNRVDLRDHVIGYLGGIASQVYVYGDTTAISSDDLELATDILRTMIKVGGMSEIGIVPIEPSQYKQSPQNFYTKDPSWVENNSRLSNEGSFISDPVNTLVENDILTISSLCIAEAIRLLNKNRLVLDRFAEELVRKDVLYYSDMLFIIEELEEYNLVEGIQIPEKVTLFI